MRHPNVGGRAHGRIAALSVTLVAAVIAGCGGTSAGGEGGGEGSLALAAYSTPQELYADELIPAFNETPEGEGIEFTTSFDSSGSISRAVEAGQPADYVHLSLEPDLQTLIDADLVAEDWNAGENEGIVQNSVVAFIVRPGNPKDINDWDDLVREDVEVLTPNPSTSGSARWNIMAAYGQALNGGASEQEALDFVRRLLQNTSVQDKSAREAIGTFTGGKGDVLIGYENEALLAQEAGEELDYVVPDDTILIETPAAVTQDSSETAQAFYDYLLTPDAQRIFAEAGYRPVDESVLGEFEQEFPEPAGLFDIDEFGGWPEVAEEFFDTDSGSVTEIQRELGNPVE